MRLKIASTALLRWIIAVGKRKEKSQMSDYKHKSKVVVLLATYNGEKYIVEQLNSLVNQTYTEFVCFIHDDGSSDRTYEICKDFCNTYPTKFQIMNYDSVAGAKANFLSMLKRVEAEYFFFCDQDDVWDNSKIEKMLKKAESVKDLKNGKLVFSDLQVVDENLNVYNDSFFELTHMAPENINYKNVLVKGYIPGCAMLIDSNLREKVLQYNCLDNLKMHDWWIAAVAFFTNASIMYEKEPLVKYRQHHDNTIGIKDFSTWRRIQFNVKRILDGSIFHEKKINISTPRRQAEELSKIKNEDEIKLDFVKQYASIGQSGKIYRMLFYAKNFKNVYRMGWMLLWV